MNELNIILPIVVCIMMICGYILYDITYDNICVEEYQYSKTCYVCDETNTSCLKGEVENNFCKTGFIFDVKYHNNLQQEKRC